jgi:cytochrome b561
MADQNAFDTATRIAAGDDKTNYDNVAITLHWLTALLVIVLFGLAETWDYFSKPTQDQMQSIHVSLGMLLALVVVTRIAWRLIPGHQRQSIVGDWMKFASKAVHYLLYLLLAVQVCLGFAFRWSQGHPASFFGLFAIPGPFGAVDKSTRHLIHSLHEYVGWTIIIVAFGHALAALYHHYGLHDRVLGRMLPLARRSEEPAG